jgi:ribulose-5-phosphate 4-epimerase/fuculose-1-phosphate aldolase
MKIGNLVLLPYYPPGDVTLANAVREVAGKHHAILLANHGPVVAGKDLESAVYATEELEETAKLYLMLRGNRLKILSRNKWRNYIGSIRPEVSSGIVGMRSA